jgi:prephenate dehydratase
MRVAIQGVKGSFHHVAAESHFGGDIELVCCDSFAAVFDALAKRKADTGVVAAENSIAGTVHPVYDLLLAHDFSVIGEVYENIHHCLIGLPGTKIESVTRVYSHPMALPQCSDFLDDYIPNAARIEFSDTAASVAFVKKSGDTHSVAIAGSLAAKLNNLPVLHANIENYQNNVTRFLVLGHEHSGDKDANKASLVLETPHEPGALVSALSVFAKANINLTKLESRPIPSEPWRYQFLIDVDAASESLHAALAQLKDLRCTVRILGEYVASNKELMA